MTCGSSMTCLSNIYLSNFIKYLFYSATPSPAVDSVGTNGLFLRPGNHSSSEVIPKEVLLTLWKDIRTHRHSYVFDQPVDEGEVPGYHSAIKKFFFHFIFKLIYFF